MRRILHTIQGLSRPSCMCTVLLIAFGLACLNGCVSKSQHASVLKELDYCEIDNVVLQERVQSLKTEKGDVDAQLRGEKELAKKRVRRLEAEKGDVDAQLRSERRSAEVAHALYESLVSGLASELATQQVEIEQMQSGVTVNLPGEVLFSTGSAELTESGKEVLFKVGDKLREVPYQTVVAGFTDNVPIGGVLVERYPTNWELAGARAARVVRLLEEAGVSSNRLLAVSFGENQPEASNDTLEGRAENRRIEIRLRPIVMIED